MSEVPTQDKPTSKAWWKSKTLWFNVAVLALASAETQVGVLKDVLPGNVFTWLVFVLPPINVGLRLISTTALVLKAPPP